MTPLDIAIRQNQNWFDEWNKKSGALNPINGDYFELLYMTKVATVRGYNAKIKEIRNMVTVYELTEWFLYSCAPHSDLDALEEFYAI